MRSNPKLEQEITEGIIDGLRECAPDLKEKSEKLCPKKRGYNGGLVSTASVEVDPESLSLRMKYEADHALFQHEGRRYKHKPGEQAKFLEQPLMENGPRYLQIIADAIRRRIGR